MVLPSIPFLRAAAANLKHGDNEQKGGGEVGRFHANAIKEHAMPGCQHDF